MSVFEQPAETLEMATSSATLTAAPALLTSSTDANASVNGHADAATGLEPPPAVDIQTIAPPQTVPEVAVGMRLELGRFERLTGVVGMLLLLAGLAVWRFKPHSDDRLALVILVCAMFLAIIHHYSLEENRRSGNGSLGGSR